VDAHVHRAKGGRGRRAKSQLKASPFLSLDGTSAIAEDIGRQVVASGRRFTPKQIENTIEAVTVDEIKRVAQKYFVGQGRESNFHTRCS